MGPKDELPPIEGDNENFPDIPTNNRGKLSTPPPGSFPDISTNDFGSKMLNNEPFVPKFPDIDTNDMGVESD